MSGLVVNAVVDGATALAAPSEKAFADHLADPLEVLDLSHVGDCEMGFRCGVFNDEERLLDCAEKRERRLENLQTDVSGEELSSARRMRVVRVIVVVLTLAAASVSAQTSNQNSDDADSKPHPCEHNEKYRAFDFWIGEWDVFNSSGQKIGKNIIQRSLRGCLILEQWVDAFGSSGMSLNYFDPSTNTWHQNWVDDGGGVVRYQGEIVNGEMRYEGENIQASGKKRRARVILKPIGDGRVSHRIETSTDEGATWSVSFDGTYVPRKKN